jgi:sugar fermentation stimulation protein A
LDWQGELQGGILLRRYKRFLADVVLDNGDEVTVHCPNTGAMTACDVPGSRVWLSVSENPKRKYNMTWELVETSDGAIVCIHSALANGLLGEALAEKRVAELAAYSEWQREKKLATASRIDFYAAAAGGLPECYVEVKSVTLDCGGGLGAFPDAVSKRASRHVRDLLELRELGARVVLLFAVLHEGIQRVVPAEHIDPVYARTLRDARGAGLEVYAYRADINLKSMALTAPLPVII